VKIRAGSAARSGAAVRFAASGGAAVRNALSSGAAVRFAARTCVAAVGLGAVALAGCGRPDAAASVRNAAPALPSVGTSASRSPGGASTPAPAAGEEKALNLYIWNDYLAPDTISGFEKETGIEVAVSNYGSNEELEAKLAAGHSGYDVVVPSASFYEREIEAGYYRKLDKRLLPNLDNMDSDIETRLARHDPGNEHAVLHLWGTTGIGYNVAKVEEAMPNAPLDSWALVFDPDVAAHFEKCGIALLDSASEMYNMALTALGKDPNSQNPADLDAATNALLAIRPYVRYFDNQRAISDLANGEICVAVGYSGDVLQARDRAEENGTGQRIAYVIPKEGSIIWFDSYLIPKDAPHPLNAHAFIDYMLRPAIIAAVTNAVHYANGNAKAAPYLDEKIRNDPNVYPPPEVMARLVPDLADTDAATRLMTRAWQKVMTGR
jgi:putrescine transport system substrate-binding protein